MRYGINGEKSNILADIGDHFGLTRERIRQILVRAHRKILTRARREHKQGQIDAPCNQLMRYVREQVRVDEDRAKERFCEFVEDHLLHIPAAEQSWKFLLSLNYPSDKLASDFVRSVLAYIDAYGLPRKRTIRGDAISKWGNRILKQVMWPKTTKRHSKAKLIGIRPRRNISDTSLGNYVGSFLSKKMNRAVYFESNLEYQLLSKFDNSDFVIGFCEQPLEIEYETEGSNHKYYPDLFVLLADQL